MDKPFSIQISIQTDAGASETLLYSPTSSLVIKEAVKVLVCWWRIEADHKSLAPSKSVTPNQAPGTGDQLDKMFLLEESM